MFVVPVLQVILHKRIHDVLELACGAVIVLRCIRDANRDLEADVHRTHHGGCTGGEVKSIGGVDK